MKKRVLIGISGGVDSACAAFLLQQSGYEVFGAFLRLHELSGETVGDAREVCAGLGIEFHIGDYSDLFADTVIGGFRREYLLGRTPNPCVLCNPLVKFRALCEMADRLGCEFIATGHYCSVVQSGRRHMLRRSPEKDQSYALYGLKQEQLKRIIMPLGSSGMSKDEVRALAAENGLKAAAKKDSQELCFVRGSYKDYIRAEDKPGDVLDTSGAVIGRHEGLYRCTVGQRKGLGLALGRRMFVKELRPLDNTLVLADDCELYSDSLTANNLNLMSEADRVNDRKISAKIRYNHKEAACLAKTDGNTLELRFDEAQRAITPGQSVVLYDGDICLGGGIITA